MEIIKGLSEWDSWLPCPCPCPWFDVPCDSGNQSLHHIKVGIPKTNTEIKGNMTMYHHHHTYIWKPTTCTVVVHINDGSNSHMIGDKLVYSNTLGLSVFFTCKQFTRANAWLKGFLHVKVLSRCMWHCISAFMHSANAFQVRIVSQHTSLILDCVLCNELSFWVDCCRLISYVATQGTVFWYWECITMHGSLDVTI